MESDQGVLVALPAANYILSSLAREGQFRGPRSGWDRGEALQSFNCKSVLQLGFVLINLRLNT